MSTIKVFGPPGSGKTTYLLRMIEAELLDGTHPTQIGYFAFTRKAATEAKERAITKFPALNEATDFPWFRTLHSLAYRCLGITTKDMMRTEHYVEFAREAGLELSIESGDEDFMVKADHPILNEINIARIRGKDLREHYNSSEMKIEWFHFEYVERAYRQYKESKSLMDFTDLLEKINEMPHLLPSLEVLVIDEAQDLSRLQWTLVSNLAMRAQRAFLAGDDDQAIYTWAGADVNSFLAFEGDIVILEQSYRVPAKVHALANTIVNRIRTRQAKNWNPREFEGDIKYYNAYEHVDITNGEWLIMASANYMLNDMHNWIKSQGLLFERHGHRSVSEAVLNAVMGWEALRKGKEVPFSVLQQIYKHIGTEFVTRGHKTLRNVNPEGFFTLESLTKDHGLLTNGIWHNVLTKIGEEKRDYLIAMLRRGTKLSGKISIKLSTIHGAKGGEADNVLLLTDLSSKSAAAYNTNSDDINRLLYVGVTRTRQSLHLVLPKNEYKGFRL